MDSSIKYVIVQDYETGGLPSAKKLPFLDVPVCEVACVVVDMKTLTCIDEYQSLFQPHYKEGLVYDEKALEVNHLTLEQLEQGGKDVLQVYKDLRELYTKYKNPRHGAILAGHNYTGFDHPFTEALFKYCGDDVTKYVKWVEDTQKLAYYSSLSQENYKLSTCCANNGISLVDAHRAIHDTRANALLFIEYIKKLRSIATAQEKTQESFRDTFRYQIP